MKHFLLFFFTIILTVLDINAQKVPNVFLNHLFTTISNEDFDSLIKSKFVSDSLFYTHVYVTTSEDGSVKDAVYIYGLDNYLEFFDERSKQIGETGICFSTDKVGDLEKLNRHLSNTFSIDFRSRLTNYKEVHEPWFDLIEFIETPFEGSKLYMWMMEYKKEYYQSQNFEVIDSILSRTENLRFADEPRSKLMLKRFKSASIRLPNEQFDFFEKLLEQMSYIKTDDTGFVSPDGFTFYLLKTATDTKVKLKSVGFEIKYPVTGRIINISDNLSIHLDGNEGFIYF